MLRWRDRAFAWLVKMLTRWLVFWHYYKEARALRRVRHKHFWKCYRDGGGGVLRTPWPMTEQQAIRWLRETADSEIFYIDREYGFLFYRDK